MPNLPRTSKKPESKNAIDAMVFRADTLGIYGRHLIPPNPSCNNQISTQYRRSYRETIQAELARFWSKSQWISRLWLWVRSLWGNAFGLSLLMVSYSVDHGADYGLNWNRVFVFFSQVAQVFAIREVIVLLAHGVDLVKMERLKRGAWKHVPRIFSWN